MRPVLASCKAVIKLLVRTSASGETYTDTEIAKDNSTFHRTTVTVLELETGDDNVALQSCEGQVKAVHCRTAGPLFSNHNTLEGPMKEDGYVVK